MNKKSLNGFSKVFVKVPLSEKILFTKHLAMMVRAGMSEVESLKLLRQQIKSKGFKKILDSVIDDLENGQFLSDAFLPFRGVVGDLFISIIRLGETSGTLSENLDFLAEEMKKSQQLHSKVRSALIYPIIILIATIGVSGALVFFVLPRILPIFSSLNVSLPASTRALIAIANILNNYFLWVVAGFAGIIFMWILLLKIKPVRYFYHRTLISLPFVRTIVVGYNMANITRTLSILLRSGVKIVEAVKTTSGIVSNVPYQRALVAVAEDITRGETLYKYLESHTHLFPPTVGRMIEVGEKTGNLDSNLRYLSEFYENEVDETVKNLSNVLEPALLVLMGALVGFVAIAIITPIYEVTQTIGR